ncbi:ankyrin repeat-containing domain protein [Mycena alexandri]|uniref:Ankyrin repeat-containing domain protein n=1 Tax=Mycena alexandri TaxID=1745969 RepID=A0AAD6SLY2_9AGAR|nr:ankyrin repeat-containing domain protein [Mycena alexandri]
MMSAVGIWLWQDPLAFGNTTNANGCALRFSTYAVLGKFIPLKSQTLRIVSLVLYAMFLVPGLNLLIPISAFLAIILLFRACHGSRKANRFHPTLKQDLRSSPAFHSKGRIGRNLLLLRAWYNPVVFPALVCLGLLLVINLILVFDIERTLRHNARLRMPGDATWNFGQILAILLVVLPLRDLRVFGVHRDVTGSLRDALRWEATSDIIWNLARRGADVNVKANDCVHPTPLLLAVAKWRDLELTRMLLHYGADPNMPDPMVLQAAVSHGDEPIVNLLLAHGADPNIEGGTVLRAAAHSGNLKIVQLLLDQGADPNVQGGAHSTAMQAASERGHDEIVELLHEHGANL